MALSNKECFLVENILDSGVHTTTIQKTVQKGALDSRFFATPCTFPLMVYVQLPCSACAKK